MAGSNYHVQSDSLTEAKTYVLVHGAYHGGWCWKEVAAMLRSAGNTVYTPTLTGLGERSHLIHTLPTLDTMIEDVAQVLKYEELNDVIVVGHSFAGAIVSALADRMPQLLRHLVYLDAQVLMSGQAPADTAPPEIIARYLERARESDSAGVSIPSPPPENFGITEPAILERARKLVTAHPYHSYFNKLVLQHPLGNGIPATYIACAKPLHPNTAHSREVAKAQSGWRYVEIPAGHDAMLTWADKLAQMLGEIE